MDTRHATPPRPNQQPLAVPRLISGASRILEALPRPAVWFATLAVLALIGALDIATGAQVSLVLFYLVPVITAAWHLGWRPSVTVVVLSTATWLAADLVNGRSYDLDAIRYWNALVRGSLFFVVAFTVALLRQALTHERELARTDALTGVHNKRSFSEVAGRELERMRRHRLPVSLAYVDVDGFKAVNDTLGHAAGDTLLKEVAAAIVSAVRQVDVVARLGGDEFAILLPDSSQDAARAALARVTGNLDNVVARGTWRVGFSIGVVSFAAAPGHLETLVLAADEAMYAAKRAGGRSAHYVESGAPVESGG